MASCKFKNARLLGPSSSSRKKKKNKKRKNRKIKFTYYFATSLLLSQEFCFSSTPRIANSIAYVAFPHANPSHATHRVPSESALSLVGRDDVDEERDGRRSDFHP
jgi:hypothetical protein